MCRSTARKSRAKKYSFTAYKLTSAKWPCTHTHECSSGNLKNLFLCSFICHNIIIIGKKKKTKKGKSQVWIYYHIKFPLSMCPVAGQVFSSFVCLVSLLFIYLYFSLLIYLSNFCRVRDLSSNMIASLPDKVFANLNSLIEM